MQLAGDAFAQLLEGSLTTSSASDSRACSRVLSLLINVSEGLKSRCESRRCCSNLFPLFFGVCRAGTSAVLRLHAQAGSL